LVLIAITTIFGFDINRKKIFDNVTVYDSLKKIDRNDKTEKSAKFNKNCSGGLFLRTFQEFILKYVFHDYDPTKLKVLEDDPDYILKNATYCPNPQQFNTFDCGFFAIASVLHLTRQIDLQMDTYNQQNITDLRQQLEIICLNEDNNNYPDPKTSLSMSFILSFFPFIADDNTDDAFIKYYKKTVKDSIMEEINEKEIIDLMSQSQTDTEILPSPSQSIIEVLPEELKPEDIKQEYTLLMIRKSLNQSREYRCRSHVGCEFLARLGLGLGYVTMVSMKRLPPKVAENGKNVRYYSH
jgi:hypothetical protein